MPVARLEGEIEAMNAALPKLTSFILPGGTPVPRRRMWHAPSPARRTRAGAAGGGGTGELALIRYMNRLSDHLFVLARMLNDNGADDILWVPGGNLGE